MTHFKEHDCEIVVNGRRIVDAIERCVQRIIVNANELNPEAAEISVKTPAERDKP